MVTRSLRAAYALLAWLFLLALPVQFYLAGLGAFKAQSFDAHAALGSILSLVTILILILAFAGRVPRPMLKLTALLFVLMVVQNVLAALQDSVKGVAALHPVNGVLIVGVAIALANRARIFLPIERFREDAVAPRYAEPTPREAEATGSRSI